MREIYGKEFPDKFVDYIGKNPIVLKLFAQFAAEAKKAGHKKYSHWAIVNRIRWETDVHVEYDDFKISNDHIRHLARLLMIVRPEFKGFFNLKSSPKIKETTGRYEIKELMR